MNYELMENNKVFLKGEVVSSLEFSHEAFGEGFYELKLKVERLSNNYDIIPIIISEKLLYHQDFEIGKEISIQGQFRSFNKLEDGKSKLILNVFVRNIIQFDDTMNSNIVELSGYICKKPIFRMTPFGREICDVLLAVNRAYNKSDYLPCIVWGRNARFVKDLVVGQKVDIVGRIQSREYQKKLSDEDVVTKTAYEISVNKISLNEVDKTINLDRAWVNIML